MNTGHFKHLQVSESDGVVSIALNRPPLNVLNIEMLRELNPILEAVRNDDSARVLTIAGQGKVFSAGVEVAEHLPDRAEQMLRTFGATLEILGEIEIPTVAIVHGVALGGGCELATSCDFVVCAESARFGQPEIKLAAIAPVAAVTFPRMCGPKRTFELLMLGEPIGATEAVAAGLATRAVADDALADESARIVERLASMSSPVLRGLKRAIREGLGRPLGDALRIAEGICTDMLLECPDCEEGMRAFLEKRQPKWHGGGLSADPHAVRGAP